MHCFFQYSMTQAYIHFLYFINTFSVGKMQFLPALFFHIHATVTTKTTDCFVDWKIIINIQENNRNEGIHTPQLLFATVCHCLCGTPRHSRTIDQDWNSSPVSYYTKLPSKNTLFQMGPKKDGWYLENSENNWDWSEIKQEQCSVRKV